MFCESVKFGLHLNQFQISGAAASVSVTTPVEEDSDRFTPPPPPEEFASADGESQSDSCEIAPPSGFRENGDEVVHSSGDEESPDPVARTRDEIQAAVIDELKQGRVALKHNPAYGPSNSTRFHAVEMIY